MSIERLEQPGPAELDALLDVWESSVRATHAFLAEADIAALRPQVREAFGAVRLWIARGDAGQIVGFAGLDGDMLEMLFVHAEARGTGIGKALLFHALNQGATRLDVNEQNPSALGFYLRMGFEVVGRSALDGQGRPFPLLHMRLKNVRRDALPTGYAIEPAKAEHVPLLNAIERAAAAIFPPGSIPEHILSDHVPCDLLMEAMRVGTLSVALDPDRRPAGYGLLRFVDGLALLAQLDVHPQHGRRGLGTALVARIVDIALESGAQALYLTTFTHVPWNAPFYARLGFFVVSEDEQPPAIRKILADERELGLTDRVAMRLALKTTT